MTEPADHRVSLRRAAAFLAWAVGGFLLALALDGPVYRHLRLAGVEREDWFQTLRLLGTLWVWAPAAAALALVDRPRARLDGPLAALRRGLLLLGSAAISGGLAELLKILIRRERPSLHDGAYVFRPWADSLLSTTNLGLPSSHAAVAFGAGWTLTLLFPRAAGLWLALAAGCAATRLLVGVHFLSDAYAAGLLAFVVARALWRIGACRS